MAHDEGIALHVWVDETRPRNQGASLTAFELGGHGVRAHHHRRQCRRSLHAGGPGRLCIVGTDRVTANGDVANKIGTYLKALAAKDNGVPFYVALPSSTIDWTLQVGPRHSDRGTLRRRSAENDRPRCQTARSRRSRSPPRAAPPPIPASTSRRRGWSPASSPNAALARPANEGLRSLFPGESLRGEEGDHPDPSKNDKLD